MRRFCQSRWVDTNKAEEGEEDKFKSRLVVRGDLEENKGVRTDSPTASQLFINLIICWAAALGAPLRAGDISAAFLQGAWITRLLAITLPKGGIPDPAVKPGSLLVARKSVYGTRDAPRGFWKALHDVLLSKGLVPVPFETAAYYLPGPSGTIRGLLGCHVDDLLWCGLEDMQNVMLAVQKEFKFGMVEDDEMKYCGRIIKQSSRWHQSYMSKRARSHQGHLCGATTKEAALSRSQALRDFTTEIRGRITELARTHLPSGHLLPGEPTSSCAATRTSAPPH